MALRDLDGLPGASNLPYFFFDDGTGDVAFPKSKVAVVPVVLEPMLFDLDEMLDDTCELVLLFTVCGDWKRNQLMSVHG